MCADTRWILNKFFETWDVAHHFEFWTGEKNIYIFFTSTFISSTRRRRLESRRFVCRLLHTQTTTPSATRQIEVQFKRIVFLAFAVMGNSIILIGTQHSQKPFPHLIFFRLHQDTTWIFLQYYRALFFSETIHWSGKQPLSLTASHSQGHIIIIVSQPSRAETSVEISTL